MAIEKVIDILKDADRHKYGVVAVNIFNYESIAWAIEVAEEEKMPIIIQFYPGFKTYIPLSTVALIVRDLASKVRIPVGLHLDHSNSFEQVMESIRFGFPSVMIDGSSLPFEDNVAITKEVVKSAHAMGVQVESELGHVGSGSDIADFSNEANFTPVEKAVEFIDKTGADSLAISIGNGHGQYIATPKLDFDRIKKIKEAVPEVPLVMHGSSDIPDAQIQKAVTLGMSKFNIFTEYDRAFYRGFYKVINDNTERAYMFQSLMKTKEAAKDLLRGKIRLLNPNCFKLI